MGWEEEQTSLENTDPVVLHDQRPYYEGQVYLQASVTEGIIKIESPRSPRDDAAMPGMTIELNGNQLTVTNPYQVLVDEQGNYSERYSQPGTTAHQQTYTLNFKTDGNETNPDTILPVPSNPLSYVDAEGETHPLSPQQETVGNLTLRSEHGEFLKDGYRVTVIHQGQNGEQTRIHIGGDTVIVDQVAQDGTVSRARQSLDDMLPKNDYRQSFGISNGKEIGASTERENDLNSAQETDVTNGANTIKANLVRSSIGLGT